MPAPDSVTEEIPGKHMAVSKEKTKIPANAGKAEDDEAYSLLKLENQLCFPLYAAARHVINSYTPYLKPLGLTYTQYLVLLVLWEAKEASVGDLCRKLYLDNGTISPVIKKMEKDGIVTRCRLPEDERVVRVCVTEKGMELREAVKDIPVRVGSCLAVSREDAQSLYRLLYGLLQDDMP
jgi:DNA-binding MarR family transcriptional regulator